MGSPPSSPPKLSGSTEPSGTPPPPPGPPPPPPPRYSIARRRPFGSHSKRAQLFSSGSIPHQLLPRMARRSDSFGSHSKRGHAQLVSSGSTPRHLLPRMRSRSEALSNEFSRFKMLSVDDFPPALDSSGCSEPGTTDTDTSKLKMSSLDNIPHLPRSTDCNGEEGTGKDTSDTSQYSSDSDSNEDGECPFGNPFVEDRFGNLTNLRLSDLSAAFSKYLEDEASKPKPKEKKYSKEEKLKRENDCMKQYMNSALQKYNNEENLVGDMCFKFLENRSRSFIVEGGFHFYYHFNFAAEQNGSKVCLFFAEVIPVEGDVCDVLCCKLLDDTDNGHCFGCKNHGSEDLHPSCDSLYVAGHEDSEFPFMVDSDNEDDSD